MTFERLAPEQFDTIPGIPEPAENPHLFGHDEAASQLAEAYRAGRLHHALLICGPLGIGKATFAFHLARTLFAHPDHRGAPAGFERADPASQLFRLVAQGAHPSLLHLTRPANDRTKGFKSVVTVDEVRSVGRFLSLTSHDGGYRVVIVDPADDMNANAANALLKNLEEPPARTLFALIAHQPGRLLPTIRSRCLVVRLKPLAPPLLVAAMQALSATLPEGQGERLALAEQARGSLREALLMSEFGGREIAGAVEACMSEPGFDVAAASRIADAVTGRDRQVQFAIFTGTVLDRAAELAAASAGADDLAAAARRAAIQGELAQATREAATYNLDARQYVMAALRRLHEAARA